MMRRFVFLLVLLGAPGVLARDAATPAAEIDRLIADALGSPPAGNLSDYANTTGRAADRFESPAAAARRILAGTPATAQSVDRTILQLEQLATAARASASLADRLTGHRALFHAHRLRAAVHYNLFKRSLRLAELVAATYAEKDAVAAWRALTDLATREQDPSSATLQSDLRKLTASLKDLEEQCCPPDEAILKEPVWHPTRT